jgi:predicted kinase
MNTIALANHFIEAATKTYGWKSPTERTKNADTSLTLYLVAIFFFLARFLWPIQLAKLFVRARRGSHADIHPIYAEAYVISSILFELGALSVAALSPRLFLVYRHAIAALALFKLFEVVTNNLYYLIFRPILDKSPPHNTYRNFILAILGLVECWLLLSLIWYLVGVTNVPIDSVEKAIYFTSVTFFTVGYGDMFPQNFESRSLAVFTMFSSFAMIGIILSRGLAILRPPPAIAEPLRKVVANTNRPPKLVLIMGIPGSGKTTLARAVARETGLTLLNSDFLSDSFFSTSRTSVKYLSIRDSIYRGLYRTAKENLSVGNGVIIDAPHIKPMRSREWRDSLISLTSATGSELRIVRCYCNEEELRNRIATRAEARDAEKLTNWRDFISDQPIRDPIPLAHIDVDTHELIEDCVNAVLEYLDK